MKEKCEKVMKEIFKILYLQYDSRRFKSHFNSILKGLIIFPIQNFLNISLRYLEIVTIAHGTFQENSDGKW